MISRRITFSALFILILVASLFAGLTSCSDVLLQKESTDFALSFVAPGASSGRAADGAAHWNVTAWLELEDGTTLQSQQTAAMAGKPVAIAFAPVAAGTRLKVKVELLSAQPPLQKYAGESEFMVIAEGDKVVNLPVERAPLTAAVPQITKQPQSYPELASLETTLSVGAFSPDGGDLSYRWFSSDDPAIDEGDSDLQETTADCLVTVDPNQTKYFYCKITNENTAIDPDPVYGIQSNFIYTNVVAVTSVAIVEAPLGSQSNPVATWEELVSAVGGTATQIYINANAITATSVITISSEKQIIPLQNLTIERGADFRDSFFTIAANGTLTLTSATCTTVLDGKNIVADKAMIDSSGTLELSNVELKNGYNNSQSSSGGLFIFSGNTTLENVIFSGNRSSPGGANDIYLYQNTQNIPTLAIGTSISVAEMYFSAAMSTVYPVIQVNQNSSLKDTNKIKITVGNVNPENIQVVTKDRYTGDLNTLFTVVGTDGTSYALNEEGKVVQYSLGSQLNPVATWEELKTIIHGDELKSPIYISGTMEANETITVVNGTVELISVGSTTITRTSNFLDAFFENAVGLTFTGTQNAPIIFAGNNINATSPIISADADLTMTYCTMQNNVNTSNSGGGAILVKSGTATLNNCQFIGNKTTGNSSPGGAIYMTPPGGSQNTNKLIATNTIFQSNATEGNLSNGGAISFENTTETNILNNCSFSSNSASDTGRGGGIYVYTGAKVVLNGISMSGNTIASSDTSQTQPTQEDIYMNNAPHLTLAGQLTIPTISWNRGDYSYTKVFTSGYNSVAFAETSSIGLTISGTIPTGGLQVFVDNTALSPGQLNCISVTAEGYQCSWDTDGSGRVTFVSN